MEQLFFSEVKQAGAASPDHGRPALTRPGTRMASAAQDTKSEADDAAVGSTGTQSPAIEAAI